VDHEGKALESDVTQKRDKALALNFLKQAMKAVGNPHWWWDGQVPFLFRLQMKDWETRAPGTADTSNNRAGNSHLPFRKARARHVAISPHAKFGRKFKSQFIRAVHNHFKLRKAQSATRIRFKQKQDAALREWRDLLVAYSTCSTANNGDWFVLDCQHRTCKAALDRLVWFSRHS